MPSTYTPTATFHSPIDVPADGDAASAANFNLGTKDVADNAAYLRGRIDGTVVGGSASEPGLKGVGGSPNGIGVEGVGDGTSAGVKGTGGDAGGLGGEFYGGAPDGAGVYAEANGNGNAVEAYGGTGTGRGIDAYGGDVGGEGGSFTANGGNYAGALAVGSGTEPGLTATGGTSAGAGVKGTGRGGGVGVEGVGNGAAAGVKGTGGATSGPGGQFIGGAPNGDGIVATGDGSGYGVRATGGDGSGAGVFAIGGATNGAGVHAAGTGTGAALITEATGTGSEIQYQGRSSAPASPVEGDSYYDSTRLSLRVYNGLGWLELPIFGRVKSTAVSPTIETGAGFSAAYNGSSLRITLSAPRASANYAVIATCNSNTAFLRANVIDVDEFEISAADAGGVYPIGSGTDDIISFMVIGG